MSTHHSSGILRLTLIFLALIVLTAVIGGMAYGKEKIQASLLPNAILGNSDNSEIPLSLPSSSSKATYNCRFQIFIVEPISYRYWDYYQQGFQNGVVDFALIEELHIQDSHSGTVIWDGDDSPGNPGGFTDIEESNIMAIAVMYNLDEGHIGESDPDLEGLGDPGYDAPPYDGRPYWAGYVDAAAGATPGNHGSNTSGNGSTHTVFIDEGTANF